LTKNLHDYKEIQGDHSLLFSRKQIREIKGNKAYPPRLPAIRTRVAGGADLAILELDSGKKDRGETI